MLEGARRVGKSTIAESFAQNEYKSYILIDFSKTTNNIRECFDDIGNLNVFFLRLQAETGVTLYEHGKSDKNAPIPDTVDIVVDDLSQVAEYIQK